MKNKPLVTIATIAYNEERNINRFLDSVLSQKETGFIIKQILVISDGSKDRTVNIVSSFKDSRIKIKDYNNRIGKSSRLNEIYSEMDTDILIQSDADVVYAHPYVISSIIHPFVEERKVAMCGGNPLPVKGNSIIEKAINITTQAYIEFRKTVRGGDNVFSADGRILAFKKELVQKIAVPKDMIANDMFTYFCCLMYGYKYKYVDSAIVYYYSPKTLSDHIRQNVRFRAAPIRMEKYFPHNLVHKELSVPKNVFLRSLLKQFIKQPLLSSFIYLVNIYRKFKAKITEHKLNAKWQIAHTTKYV